MDVMTCGTQQGKIARCSLHRTHSVQYIVEKKGSEVVHHCLFDVREKMLVLTRLSYLVERAVDTRITFSRDFNELREFSSFVSTDLG